MTATTEESVIGGGANYSPTPPDSSMTTSTTSAVTVTDQQQLMEEGGVVGGESLKGLEGEEPESTSTPSSDDKKEDEEMEEYMANMDIVIPGEAVEAVPDLGNVSKSDDDDLHIDLGKEGMEVEEDKDDGEDSAVPAEIQVEEPMREANTEEDKAGGNNDLSKEGEGGDDGDGPPVPVAAPEVEDEADLVVVGGSDDKNKEAGESSTSAKDTHLEREAELQAYLDSLKPKPKRKSIKEMLMAMPGFKDIATLKPKIGGDVQNEKKDVVIFDEAENRRRSKRQQQIEALKDRFVKHALVAPPKKTKGEHIKLKIQSKEEDSQGIEHLKENEVDYVRDPMNEEEEPMGPLTLVSTSPQGEKPGAKRASLRQNLLEIITKNRREKYEYEKNKETEEKKEKEEEVEVESEEEIVGDEEISDEDSEVGEEEEELEFLLSGPKKKKSAFVDDEAEDEDGDDENDDDDDDSDSSEDEDEEAKPAQASKSKTEEKAELESIADSQDSLPGPAVLEFQNNEQESTTKQSDNENSISMDFAVELTPKVCPVTINPLTPSDFSRHSDGLSPLIPRIQRTTEFVDMEKRNLGVTSVADSLSNVISENSTKFDDLVDLCSGKFVTQRNSEIQDDDDEFENFDFGDDDDVCEENNKPDENRECVKTPVNNTSTRNAVDGITPKLSAKPTIARRSMQFDMEQEAEDDAEKSIVNKEEKSDNQLVESILDDDDDEEVGARKSIGKKKRLQFSDDEDDVENETEPPNQVSEDEQSEEEEEIESPVDIEPEEPVVHNPFFNKRGMLKRKFVDEEAELSGSEEGSADEDERGLNDYEDEEGDDEEIDEDLVRNQVERAHLKHLLDTDDRKIRLLQNRFCENGDLTGAARTKTTLFKLTASDLNDDAHMGGSDDEDQAPENPEEILQKQEWVEKRKWMSENSHLLENDADESQSLLTSFKIGKQTLKRIESFVDTSTSDSKDFNIKETSNRRKSFLEELMNARKAAANSSNSSLAACSEGFNFGQVGNDTNMSVDESSKSMSEPMFGGVSWTKNIATAAPKKGSFLSRGGMMLAKLAETSKPGDTVSNVKNNSRNFVFSHITPPNQDKTDGSTSRVKRATNKSSCNAQAKKIKVDRSFNNLDETSKQGSVFKFL